MRWITPWKAPCRPPGQVPGSSICWVCVRQGFVVVNIISPLRPPEQQANRSAQYELKVIRRIVQYKGTLTLEEQGEFLRKRSSFRRKNKLENGGRRRSSGNGRTAAVFCGLLDTSACEKLTNISVYIWQSKTEWHAKRPIFARILRNTATLIK